jgi:hypothetical protein
MADIMLPVTGGNEDIFAVLYGANPTARRRGRQRQYHPLRFDQGLPGMLHRRNFVKYCLAGCCAASTSAALGSTFQAGARGEAARTVGEWYLAAHPELADRKALSAMLDQAICGRSGQFDDGTLQYTRDDIRRAVANDYASGETELIGGWILAHTELRLCALAALA